MVDTTASATPMPAQPVATVTSSEAPFPPAAPPLPVFVPPVVTDPVSNLDFLPVDDAFALEMRSETIEQLVGGDALRRGVSERIEAGRSQTNADLVAGRDRVRVHGTLHEHTGHGLAEQAAHLHTTVGGVLDVHAGNEDTVLLAGHMRDVWDGGTAIVAAMTDDTVAGGGIRVTTPLGLWVHGLMGVEERIGTCTADAVLMESSATHYEREYGPGVHAAGLAVYTGSLYQSSRSTFRPLMRVSSGVRNLVAGGGGGDGGGNGIEGSAPDASPPPVPAAIGAASESVTGTLAAGCRAVEAPATTLGATDELAGARRVPLEDLVDPVDARAAEETGEADTVMRAEGLPELTRSADTAEQLGALQETLRMDGVASGSAAAGGFRGSVFEGAVSMHPAGGGGGPLEITPPSTVHGENAPMVRPHPGAPWGGGPKMKPRLLGGADRPPQSTAPKADFPAVFRRMGELREHYRNLSESDIADHVNRAIRRASERVVRQCKNFGGNTKELVGPPAGTTAAELAYHALQETARQADKDTDQMRAGAIRMALRGIDNRAVEELEALYRKYGIADASSTRVIRLPPVTAGPTATVAPIQRPARTPMQVDWFTAFRQLRDPGHQHSNTGGHDARMEFRDAADRISNSVWYKFRKLGGDSEQLPTHSRATTRTEQTYRAIEDMQRRAVDSDDAKRAYNIRKMLDDIHRITTDKLDDLTTKYGALDAPSTQAMQLPPVRIGPTTFATPPVTVASTTVAPAGQLDIPVRAHPIDMQINPAYTKPAGGLVHATDIPGPGAASGLPGPSLSEAAGAEARGLWRGWLDRPATVSGTTAAEPVAVETIVTPSLGETSTIWMHAFEPVRAPGAVQFDSGLHHAGETVQPPPVTTIPSSTATVLSRDAAFHRPPGMSGGPYPVAFDPRSALPGPSSRVVQTEAIRAPVPSTGAPLGWQGAETPGFARTASGAVGLQFLHRQRIAHRFRTDDALIAAENAFETGRVNALGWSARRWREVLNDLYWLNAVVQSKSAAAAARGDVDWHAIEELMRILDAPLLHGDAAQSCTFTDRPLRHTHD